jgi:hypothetical protein
MAIDKLKAGDKVMIAEACSHHPIGEDIGTVRPALAHSVCGRKKLNLLTTADMTSRQTCRILSSYSLRRLHVEPARNAFEVNESPTGRCPVN